MSNTVKILHAADLHLDSPFEGLDRERAARRRAEQRGLLRRVAELAEENACGLVLLAGDLLDGDLAFRETGDALLSALGDIGVPVFIAPGNHDPYSPGGFYSRAALPENVRVFTKNEIECVPLPELGVRVWGAAFTEKNAPALLHGFECEKVPGTLDIMVIHGDAVSPGSPYNPISEAELEKSGMDYVALGHIHAYSGLRRAGRVPYAWPGCAEGRGFDECGEKGVIIAEVSESGADVRLVPLGGRRYESLLIDLSDGRDPLEAALYALPESTERDIYRLTFTGACDKAPDLRAISAALSARFFELQLRDKTRPRRELWEGCGEDTLRGLFLTRLRQKYDAAEDEAEREKIALAARYGVAALENGEAPALF